MFSIFYAMKYDGKSLPYLIDSLLCESQQGKRETESKEGGKKKSINKANGKHPLIYIFLRKNHLTKCHLMMLMTTSENDEASAHEHMAACKCVCPLKLMKLAQGTNSIDVFPLPLLLPEELCHLLRDRWQNWISSDFARFSVPVSIFSMLCSHEWLLPSTADNHNISLTSVHFILPSLLAQKIVYFEKLSSTF